MRKVLACCAVTLFSGCTVSPLSPPIDDFPTIDFSQYTDSPLPEDVKVWLLAGKQADISAGIRAEAERIWGRNRRERLFKGAYYLLGRFDHDPWDNDRAFSRRASQLFDGRTVGGCSDYALAVTSFMRALDIPARMVITVNVDWITAYQQNPLSIPRGHTFVEVYLEDRWYLLDVPFRALYSEYVLSSRYYPHGELFCRRGGDSWEMGLMDVKQLTAVMKHCMKEYEKGDYQPPEFKEHAL